MSVAEYTSLVMAVLGEHSAFLGALLAFTVGIRLVALLIYWLKGAPGE